MTMRLPTFEPKDKKKKTQIIIGITAFNYLIIIIIARE